MTYIDYFRIHETYKAILRYLGLNYSLEYDATVNACLISKSIGLNDPYSILNNIYSRLYRKIILVVGAGPSIYDKDLLARLIEYSDHIVCADGACRAIIEAPENKLDRIIISVTDLDGGIQTVEKTLELSGYAFIHVHGDNIDLIYNAINIIRKYRSRIVLTTQTIPPCDKVIMIPGFTDGDRSIALAKIMNPKSILQIGMDLNSSIASHYTKPDLEKPTYITPNKKLKMKLAKLSLETLLPPNS